MWAIITSSVQNPLASLDLIEARIFSGSSNDNGVNEVYLFIINSEEFDQKKTSLKYNDEIIDIQISSSFLAGSEIRFTAPDDWEYAELIVEDKIVDRIDFIDNEPICFASSNWDTIKSLSDLAKAILAFNNKLQD